MDDKTRPDETGYRFIGKPLPRKEDARLITGKGRFTDDFNLDGQAYAVMVRSPHPHARIVAIDAAQAKAMPGVLGVFTGADCLADKLGPIPHDPVPKTKFDMKLTGPKGGAVFIGPNALLPADKVRHVGEAVAMVVAETKAQALDAAEALEVRYQELPFVLHSEDAMKPGAPLLWDEVPGNRCVVWRQGDAAATPGRRPADRLARGVRAVRGRAVRAAGGALHGLRHTVLPPGLPARQPHPRVERPGLPLGLVGGGGPAARDQQLSRVHRAPVPGAVRGRLRARHQRRAGHHQAGRG